jgi:rare lipoprotein A
MGSIVKVTNVNNGLSVDARINDRGPYVPGRSLDLSTRAARDIGLADQGVAKVKISSLRHVVWPRPYIATDPLLSRLTGATRRQLSRAAASRRVLTTQKLT